MSDTPATIDLSKILAGIPKGAWVALASDERTVLAFSADLQEALERAREKGEENPIIVKVPDSDASLLLGASCPSTNSSFPTSR
jgi:hypothetical protein